MFGKNDDLINPPRNIQILLTEVFKTTENLAPLIMEGMFDETANNYNFNYNLQELVTEKREKSKQTSDYKLSSATIMVTFAWRD